MTGSLLMHIPTNTLREMAHKLGLSSAGNKEKPYLIEKLCESKRVVSIAIRLDTLDTDTDDLVVLGDAKMPLAEKKSGKKKEKPAEKKPQKEPKKVQGKK
jgi:hypothetical protein